MRRCSSTSGGLAIRPPGRPQTSVSSHRGGGEVDPHEVQRGGVGADAPERAGVALGPGAVVEEPGRTEGEHGVPPVGLAGHRAVAGGEGVVGDEVGAVPARPQERVVADHVDGVAVGREPGDRGLGHLARRDDLEGDRVEHDQLGRRCGRRRRLVLSREEATEVLGDEVAVGQRDEAVVGRVPREGDRGQHGEIGGEAVGVAAEDGDEVATRLHGDAAGPRRPHRAGRPTGPGTSRVSGSISSTQAVSPPKALPIR